MSDIETHPVQTYMCRPSAAVPKIVTMAAYEVYSKVYGRQEALITGNCRGGFSVSELIGFLYARSFPQAEWRQRFEEATIGMKNL